MENEDDWRYQVGELMIRFAEIESHIAGCLISLPDKSVFDNYNNKDFKVRCNKAISLANEANIKSKTKKEIISSINSAMKLATYRNLIAHNPINMSLESIFEDKLRYEIRSYRNNEKYIELKELKEVVKSVQECSGILYEALSSAESQIYA